MLTYKKNCYRSPQGSLMGIIIPNKKLFKMAAILQWEDLQTSIQFLQYPMWGFSIATCHRIDQITIHIKI